MDVLETNEDFRIWAELSGMEYEDVNLSVEGKVLMISGYQQQDGKDKGTRYHRTERPYGRFECRFTVPDVVDQQKIVAEIKNGILTVHLPKSEKAHPRSIEVSAT